MNAFFSNRIKWGLLPLLIVIAWFVMARYTFNSKLDLNGDNFYYYITATSLAQGQGYSDLSTIDASKTSVYPPGYPILMAPLRAVTDSIVAQKWLNELFVLVSLLLLYAIFLHLGMGTQLAFTAAVAGAFIPRLLHFSTMMMAESSALLSSVLAFYFLMKMLDEEKILRSKWFYLMLVSLILNYHIRTQGLALMVGIMAMLLLCRKWAVAACTAGGFVAGCIPWILRNKLLGLTNTRYFDMVMMANPWRPEEGMLTMGEAVKRFFETLKMLIFNAVPNTTLPFLNVDPDDPTFNAGIILVGLITTALIIVGCIRFGRIGLAFLAYIAATLCLISCFSTPSGSRYITALLPILMATEFIGLYQTLKWLFGLKWTNARIPALLLLPLLLLAKTDLKYEHELSNMKYNIPYAQYFEISKMLKKAPEGSIVCARKPQMSYLYSGLPTCSYLMTNDHEKLVRDLLNNKVDYVIVDALGFSSTPLYLIPAINEYSRFFKIVYQYKDTNTLLLFFDRGAAGEFLK